jgi:hypothetical protein
MIFTGGVAIQSATLQAGRERACSRIKAADRAARERLLRYCARPPRLQRLRPLDPERFVYDYIGEATTPPHIAPARGPPL